MATQRRAALIFAVDEYDHPDLQRLSAPMADADALADTLGRPELGGFSVEICHNATSATTAERLEDFLSERRPGDLALLHFSGHGLKDESGSLYLAARNTVPTRLASTAVDTTLINLLMRRSRAGSIVLFLDCCYGGAFERGMTARAAGRVAVRDQFSQEPLGGGRGRVVITASSAVQYAFEGTRLSDGESIEPSLFTGAVVNGIRSGAADRDADGLISLSELYEYVYENVLEQSPHQTPSKWEYGLEGELIISKSPRRYVRPVQLPEQLQEIIHHTYPVARRGAIDELRRLAIGENLPMALAAVRALRDMRDDDSRSIAAEATAAVNGLSIATSIPAVAFGEVALGSEPPVALCELVGPPLVEVAEVTAAPTAFSAHLDGRTIHLTMDTSSPAELTGTVTISSAIGDVVVPLSGAIREPLPVKEKQSVLGARQQEPDLPEPPPALIAEPVVARPLVAADDADDPATPVTSDPRQAKVPPVDVPMTVTVVAPEAVNGDESAGNSAQQDAGGEQDSVERPSPRLPPLGAWLAVAGGILLGLALFEPWVSNAYGGNTIWVDSALPGVVLLLPAIVVVISAALTGLTGSPVAIGALLGGAATGLQMIIETIASIADNSDAHWQAGILVQLSGVALATGGGFASLAKSGRISKEVAGKNDLWSFIGAAVVGIAFVLSIINLNQYGGAVMPWMWVFPMLLALMTAPVPFLRLTKEQRAFTFAVLATYFGLWIVSTAAALSIGWYSFITDSYWLQMLVFAGAMVAGSLLGQVSTRSRGAIGQSTGDAR